MPLQATSGAASYDAFGGGVPVVPNYIEDVFSCFLYTGNATARSITNGIDLSGKGGLVWFKPRNAASLHLLYDTARGTSNKLSTNSTNGESFLSGLSSFNSDGFSLTSGANLNDSSFYFASWTFRKQPKFFDVVTYTGDGASSKTIAHNLGSVPGCIIVKPVDLSGGWLTYHQSLGNTKGVYLNTTAAQATSTGFWNNTSPTSTQFTVGSTSNDSGYTFVAYIFAHDAGGFGLTGTDNVISCGSFTTNGSGNATVTLGYEPQWVMMKASSTTSQWVIFDNMRGMPVDGGGNELEANTSGAESSGAGYSPKVTATGFSTAWGIPSSTAIYIAIRRGPMKVPTSGTSVFAPQATRTGGDSATSPNYTANFPVDLFMQGWKPGGLSNYQQAYDRLRGQVYSATSSTAAETSNTVWFFDSMLGMYAPGAGASSSTNAWLFRRAPSFFDEVCYTGTGSTRTLTHNLGAVPEMIIVKKRSASTGDDNWMVYHTGLTQLTQYALYLNDPSEQINMYGGVWGTYDTAISFTSTAFNLGNNANVNLSGSTYVAYLFASCAGVSKVGSYTGTGTTKQVNCGFTGGARFVLIKRTDGTGGDWYVWDSARGIVSGNDPYLLLNSTAAEVTNTDYIDTYSAGFEISSTAPSAINASGGSFIFLAIA